MSLARQLALTVIFIRQVLGSEIGCSSPQWHPSDFPLTQIAPDPPDHAVFSVGCVGGNPKTRSSSDHECSVDPPAHQQNDIER